MAKEVKFLKICSATATDCTNTEAELQKYLNDSWEIKAATENYVIMEKDQDETSG